MFTFPTRSQKARIEQAIAAAEAGRQGEIRVHVERRCSEPVARARERFEELGMQHTTGRRAALLYIARDSHQAAVFADEGLWREQDAPAWQRVTDLVADGFRRGEPTEGVEQAIAAIGELLGEASDEEQAIRDELPNEVTVR